MANVIEVVLKAKDQMSSKLNTADKSVSKFSKGLMAIGGAAAGIYAVNRAMNSLIGLAADQERAEHTLAAAMKQAGTYTEEAMQHNLDYAASLQKITAYGDEQIMVAQKMLTNFGIEGRMLDELTKATLDLAAAKGFDLKSAADLVAKSVGSSTNALTRYGITIEGVAGSIERQQMAVENITKLYGGAAAAEAETYHGQIKSMKDATGDLGESLGTVLIPAIKEMTGLITDLSSELNGLLPSLEDNQRAWDEWVKPILELVSGLRDAKEMIAEIHNLTSGKMSIAEMIFGDPEALESILLKLGIAEDTVKRIMDTMQRAQGEDYGYTGPSITDLAPGKWGPTKGNLPIGEVPGTGAAVTADPFEMIGPSSKSFEYMSEVMPSIAEAISNSMLGIADATQTASGEIETLGEGFDALSEADEIFIEMGLTAENVATGIGNAFGSAMGQMIMHGGNMADTLKSAFKSWAASVIADIARVIAKLLVMKAIKMATTGPLGFLFAGGGVVPAYPMGGITGRSPSIPNDHVLAAVKPGEMILNTSQQSRLFAMIAGGGGGGAATVNNYYTMPTLDAKSLRHFFRYGNGRRELLKAGF